MKTCKNGVEWLVSKGDADIHIYVCNEHLVPAIKEYSRDVKVNKVAGCTNCRWTNNVVERQSRRIATELEELGLGVIELAQELNNSLS